MNSPTRAKRTVPGGWELEVVVFTPTPHSRPLRLFRRVIWMVPRSGDGPEVFLAAVSEARPYAQHWSQNFMSIPSAKTLVRGPGMREGDDSSTVDGDITQKQVR